MSPASPQSPSENAPARSALDSPEPYTSFVRPDDEWAEDGVDPRGWDRLRYTDDSDNEVYGGGAVAAKVFDVWIARKLPRVACPGISLNALAGATLPQWGVQWIPFWRMLQ
jgi:hypothetical protein